MSPFKLLRRHWHDLGLVSAMVALLWLTFAWNDLVILQRLLLLNFIVVLLHQFEEYSWPGGFPAVANVVMFSSANADRYPLNQNSSMVANVIFAYGFYLLPVFFPQAIWLGLAPVLVGLTMQFVGHVIYVNLKLKTLYSPGVATTLFGHVPVGLIYVYFLSADHLASGWDWLGAIVYMVAGPALIFGVIENVLLSDKNSPYPFDPDEMTRMDIQGKLERARR